MLSREDISKMLNVSPHLSKTRMALSGSGYFEGERVRMPFPLFKKPPERMHGNGVPMRSGGFGGRSTDVN